MKDCVTMILIGVAFWKAFFDITNPNHIKAKNELIIYDKEKILINQYSFFKVIVWLEENNKKEHSKWFFDYVLNTNNVRLIYLGKEELTKIALKSQQNLQNLDHFESVVIEYLKNRHNCDHRE